MSGRAIHYFVANVKAVIEKKNEIAIMDFQNYFEYI